MIGLGLVAMALFLGGTIPQAEARSVRLSCQEFSMPSVKVRMTEGKINIDHNHSHEELAGFDSQTISPYEAHVRTRVAGLARGGIQLKSNIRVAWQTFPSHRRVCLWYDTIEWRLHFTPTIFMDKSIKRGSCEYDAVLEHELKHVDVDRKLIRKYRPKFEREIRKFVRKFGVAGPYPIENTEKMKDYLSDVLAQHLSKLEAEMTAERMQRQQAIDTLEEYRRVQNQC